MGFAALHHPLQHRPFAEVLQLLEVPLEFAEALRVAFQENTLLQSPGWAPGGAGAWWHCSYGYNTVRVWQPQASPPPTPHLPRSSSLCSSPGWHPAAPSNSPFTTSSPCNKPKAWRCNCSSYRPTCSIVATEMWGPPCTCNSRRAPCSTPTAGWAPALSPPSLEPSNSSAWGTPAPVRPASFHWIGRWPCPPARSPTNSSVAWSRPPYRILFWNRSRPLPS